MNSFALSLHPVFGMLPGVHNSQLLFSECSCTREFPFKFARVLFLHRFLLGKFLSFLSFLYYSIHSLGDLPC